MNKNNSKKIFIILFAILYICVGLVSTIHAVSFFGLANTPILGTILAVTFEIGQAAVLFNLLTSSSQRRRFMPWCLMCILTLVQILGNIFSSYKYLITNSSENLRYFKEPIFVWTDLPDNITTVIVTYIVGAILPVVALSLTEMVVSYLNDDDSKEKSSEEDVHNNEVFINNEQEENNEQILSSSKDDFEEINDEPEEEEEPVYSTPIEENEEINDEPEEIEETEKVDPIEEELKKKNSKFINL